MFWLLFKEELNPPKTPGSPTGRGHAPHTQTTRLLMAQPCFGMTVGTDTVIPARDRKGM